MRGFMTVSYALCEFANIGVPGFQSGLCQRLTCQVVVSLLKLVPAT